MCLQCGREFDKSTGFPGMITIPCNRRLKSRYKSEYCISHWQPNDQMISEVNRKCSCGNGLACITQLDRGDPTGLVLIGQVTQFGSPLNCRFGHSFRVFCPRFPPALQSPSTFSFISLGPPWLVTVTPPFRQYCPFHFFARNVLGDTFPRHSFSSRRRRLFRGKL
jgi:hypothetical protein